MKQALHAEWTKLRTLSSTAWLLAAAVVSTMVLGAATTGSIHISRCPTPTHCPEDMTKLAFTGVWFGQVAVAVLAGLTVTNEYSSGMIHTTLVSNPRRFQVLTAKAAVITTVVVVAGMLAVAGSFVVARAVLQGNGFTAAKGYATLSLSDEPTMRAAAGTVIYLGLVALLTLGFATMIRDTAVALTTTLGILFAFPIIAQFVSDPQLSKWLGRLSPMTAGLAVQATRDLRSLPIGPWAGLGVLAAYAGAALLLGGVLFKVRDA